MGCHPQNVRHETRTRACRRLSAGAVRSRISRASIACPAANLISRVREMATMRLIHSRALKKRDKAQARPDDEQRKRMSARKRVLVGSASVLAIGGAGAVLAPATPASAVVLVNYDGGPIHLGQSLQVGVWYQQFSGGPTGYWAGVWSVPAHKWIFSRSGHASASGWRMWPVKPPKRGEYHNRLQRRRHQGHVLHRSEVGSRSVRACRGLSSERVARSVANALICREMFDPALRRDVAWEVAR